MNELTKDIVNTANNFVENFSEEDCPFIISGALDYSIESLTVVDRLLDDMSDYELDEDAMDNVTSMVGCYVFETARKNYGGEYFWEEDEGQPVLTAGLPDFQVSIRAWEKVRKFLENGKEDSISFYVAGYQEHIQNGKKGDIATLV